MPNNNISGLERELKKAVKSCSESADINTDVNVAKIYRLLAELPMPMKICLQSFIYDYPLTKPLKEKYPLLSSDSV